MTAQINGAEWDTSSLEFSFDDPRHHPVVPEGDHTGAFLVGFCILVVCICFARKAIKQRDLYEPIQRR